MARLGDTNNPVDGSGFNLPSGYSIDEDNGDLAIRDTNGTVVMKWDSGATQWDFQSNDLTNVGAANVEDIDVEDLSASVYLSSSTTLSADTDTKIPFDTVENDDDNLFDTSTEQFSPTKDGSHTISGGVGWNNATSGDNIRGIIYKNGSRYKFAFNETASFSSPIKTFNIHLPDLTTSDTVAVYARSSAANDVRGNDFATFASFERDG